MNENDKDWKNPAFGDVYVALAIANQFDGASVYRWLNAHGFANLTCCPECHVDDFCHASGCSVANNIQRALYYEPGLAGGWRRGR